MFCAIAVEANSKLQKAKSRFVFIIYFCFVFVYGCKINKMAVIHSPLLLYSVGLLPVLCLNERLKYFGSLNPQA